MTGLVLALLLAPADAQEAESEAQPAPSSSSWSAPKPYAYPIVGFSAVWLNGATIGLIEAGAGGGVITRYENAPHWYSNSRVQVLGQYGFSTDSNNLGADARVGSFIGPDMKFLRLQTGPDVWYNGYGRADDAPPDPYHLAWAPGIDWKNTALVKLGPGASILGEATPGLGLGAGRGTQVFLMAALAIHTKGFGLTVGYSRFTSVRGTTEGLILGGRI